MPIARSRMGSVSSQWSRGPIWPRCSSRRVWSLPFPHRQFELGGEFGGNLVGKLDQEHPQAAPGVHVLDVHEPTPPQDGHPIGDGFDLGEHVARKDDGLPQRAGLPHQSQHLAAGRGVKRGGGFIENQDVDRVGERQRQRQLLLHSGGIGAHLFPEVQLHHLLGEGHRPVEAVALAQVGRESGAAPGPTSNRTSGARREGRRPGGGPASFAASSPVRRSWPGRTWDARAPAAAGSSWSFPIHWAPAVRRPRPGAPRASTGESQEVAVSLCQILCCKHRCGFHPACFVVQCRLRA